MIAKNNNNGFILADNLQTANTLLARMKGLLGRASLPKGYGLHIIPCNGIHMFFMRFAIDAVFIDKHGVVIQILRDFKPWRMSPVVKKAYSVLELPCATVGNNVKEGDVILFD